MAEPPVFARARRRAHGIRVALVMALMSAFGSGALADEPADPGAALLIEFSEAPGALVGDFVGPRLRVYDDGLAVLEYPPVMRRAGTYTMQLDAETLAAVEAAVLTQEILGFDADAVRRRARQRRPAAQKGGLIVRPQPPEDATISVLSVSAGGGGGANKPARAGRSIRWQGVAEDARAHPDIEALQALDRAQQALRSLRHSPDWVAR